MALHATDEKNDADAAHTHALSWALTGDADHGAKAIAIMSAWSAVLQSHQLSNGPLGYTGTDWSANDVSAFAQMLKNVYLPQVIKGSSANGNWDPAHW